MAERAFARALGGSCHSPVGALARAERGHIRFAAEVLSADGKDRVRDEASFPCGKDEPAAKLAKAMLERAPDSIRSLFAHA
jgi:hydroxymethylbilane synthase